MSTDTLLADCWARIGVHGDGSCEHLAEHVRCRNCPVFAAAAVQALDRDRPVASGLEELERLTRQFAAAEATRHRGAHSAFACRVGEEWLALPTRVVAEVADLRPVHSLPHRRSGVVLGVANVRGELLVCVSLARLLAIEPAQPAAAGPRGSRQRLLVLRQSGDRFACPVDEVHGTLRYDDHETGAVPSTVARASASFTRAMLPWQGHALGLLDEELLFHSLGRSLA